MVNNGNRVTFDEKRCRIYNRNEEQIGVAHLINNMYKLQLVPDSSAFAATVAKKVKSNVNSISDVCHLRLGHVGFDKLKQMKNSVVGVNFSNIISTQCETCIMGKQSRKSFQLEGRRATEPLELVHSDVCGPMSEKSSGGGRYFVTFLDDYSRKLFVYILRQ